jgi:hypothetical protein
MRSISSVAADFERELESRGWTFDAATGNFCSDHGHLEWEDVIGLIPGMTLDELEEWVDDQLEKWQRSFPRKARH